MDLHHCGGAVPRSSYQKTVKKLQLELRHRNTESRVNSDCGLLYRLFSLRSVLESRWTFMLNSTTEHAHFNIGTTIGSNQFSHERFEVVLQIRSSVQNDSRCKMEFDFAHMVNHVGYHHDRYGIISNGFISGGAGLSRNRQAISFTMMLLFLKKFYHQIPHSERSSDLSSQLNHDAIYIVDMKASQTRDFEFDQTWSYNYICFQTIFCTSKIKMVQGSGQSRHHHHL